MGWPPNPLNMQSPRALLAWLPQNPQKGYAVTADTGGLPASRTTYTPEHMCSSCSWPPAMPVCFKNRVHYNMVMKHGLPGGLHLQIAHSSNFLTAKCQSGRRRGAAQPQDRALLPSGVGAASVSGGDRLWRWFWSSELGEKRAEARAIAMVSRTSCVSRRILRRLVAATMAAKEEEDGE